MSSASACAAPTRPRSASTGGWMPRTTERSSARAVSVVSRASPTSLRAPSGSRSNISSAIPRLSDSATSRACAPSCRSRSSRRSSAAEWSTASARVSVSCSTRRSRRSVTPGESSHWSTAQREPHQGADGVVPDPERHDAEEQHHDGQRDHEPEGHRRQHPAEVAPGHRVGRHRPQLPQHRQPLQRRVRRGQRSAENVGSHAPVGVGQPAGGRDRERKEQPADPDHHQHTADDPEHEEHDDRHERHHLEGGVTGQPEPAQSGFEEVAHPAILPDHRHRSRWCRHHFPMG